MSYNNKNWLYDEYKALYVEHTETELTDEEINYLNDYFDPLKNNAAKEIYYLSILRLKRGWNEFIVYYLIAYALKKDFNKAKNMDALVKSHKIFAKKMLNDVIKAYCKISD